MFKMLLYLQIVLYLLIVPLSFGYSCAMFIVNYTDIYKGFSFVLIYSAIMLGVHVAWQSARLPFRRLCDMEERGVNVEIK